MISKILDEAQSRMVSGVPNGRLLRGSPIAELVTPVSSSCEGHSIPLCGDISGSFQGTSVSSEGKPFSKTSVDALNQGVGAGIGTDADKTRGIPPRKRPVYRWG